MKEAYPSPGYIPELDDGHLERDGDELLFVRDSDGLVLAHLPVAQAQQLAKEQGAELDLASIPVVAWKDG